MTHNRRTKRLTRPHNRRSDFAMTSYKILITRKDGQVLVIESRFMGDHAAIRRAKTLAMAGDQVEVRRGAVSVFGTGGAAVPG